MFRNSRLSLLKLFTHLIFSAFSTRYDRCLEIGMDPQWVLTGEQKKVRFRNLLNKRHQIEQLDQQLSQQLDGYSPEVADSPLTPPGGGIAAASAAPGPSAHKRDQVSPEDMEAYGGGPRGRGRGQTRHATSPSTSTPPPTSTGMGFAQALIYDESLTQP